MLKTDNVWLMLGDCLERMREIPDGSVDLILTDPPYGMAFQSNRSKSGPRHKKIVGDDKVDGAWIDGCCRVLKEGGGFASFCDWNTSHEWRAALEARGLAVKSQVIWDRAAHGMGDLKGAFAPCHDVMWYAHKGRRQFHGKRPKSVIRDTRPSPANDNGHPTCKPQGLMRYLVEHLAAPDEVILDPFMGSGSTGVAAMAEGRKFIGIELDPGYAAIACNRIMGAANA